MALKNCIVIYITGSTLYGTKRPESDLDIEGIFIDPLDLVVGNNTCSEVSFSKQNDTKRNTKDDTDIKFYSLRTFLKLASNNNPNKIETFFIPNSCILYKNEKYWSQIKNNYSIFISKKIKYSFSGYAFAQKQKLINKKKRLNELREFKDILDKGIKDGKKIIGGLDLIDIIYKKFYDKQTEKIITIQEKVMKQKYEYIKYKITKEGSDSIIVDDKEFNYGMDINSIYTQICNQINAYGNRTTSLDIHSYDPKFASHIFRLINEGCELLETGKLNFPCSNAEFQKDIKLGKYDLDYLLQKVEEIEQQIENAYLNSNIQNAPQYDKINELQIKLLLEWWKERQYI